MPDRAAFYIDGFNLYHGIDDLGQPHLKWLDLWALGELLIPKKSEKLVRVVWCTAMKTGDTAKLGRHRQLIRAQEARGVTCLQGHFANEPKECLRCGETWTAPIEKQGDTNLALSILDDAYRDVFDHGYLLTADGDQVPTVRLLKERFPGKKLTTIAPPLRSHNKMILDIPDMEKIALNVDHLKRCLLPRAVLNPDGSQVIARRPLAYDPPLQSKVPSAPVRQSP